MNAINILAAAAFTLEEPFNSNNTVVYVNTHPIKLVLHGNTIASKKPHGRISITLAGWNTPTTRARLNALPGVVIRKRGDVTTLNGKEWDGTWITI